MGNEQLEAGNIAGERTCWRKLSSAVDRADRDNRGSDDVTETCEEVLKSVGKQLVDDGRLDSVSLYSERDQQQTFMSWTHKNCRKTITISKEICLTQSRSRKEQERKSIGC